jgi:F-type H+-transporting ATPase subunit epsilon
MADDVILELVTPEKLAFTGKVEEVTIPGSEGEFGVLRGHTPLLSFVDIGVMNFTQEGKKTYYAVNTGYTEVTGSKVTVLVETAERSDTIDVERAKRAQARAEEGLSRLSKEDVEYDKMKAALARAIARISATEQR